MVTFYILMYRDFFVLSWFHISLIDYCAHIAHVSFHSLSRRILNCHRFRPSFHWQEALAGGDGRQSNDVRVGLSLGAHRRRNGIRANSTTKLAVF